MTVMLLLLAALLPILSSAFVTPQKSSSLLVVAGVELRSNDDSSNNNNNNNVRSSTTLLFSAANIIPTSSSSFGSDDQPKKKKVLTEADILARSKSLRTGPFQNPTGSNKGGEDEVPKLFTPQIYNDIQTTLLLLERRVKNGKCSLDLLDIDEFVGCTSRIVNEMYDYLADPRGCSDRIAKVYHPASTFHAENGDVVTATTTTTAKTTAAKTTSVMTSTTTAAVDNDKQVYVPPPPRKGEPGAGKYRQQQQQQQQLISPLAATTTNPTNTLSSSIPAANTAAAHEQYENDDNDNNQDANVNFGLARGTTNTYIIPNMESMSPSEYQQQLQATISARQAERRKDAINNSNIIGNRSSSGYLDALSQGGDGTNRGGGSMYMKSWKEEQQKKENDTTNDEHFKEGENTLLLIDNVTLDDDYDDMIDGSSDYDDDDDDDDDDDYYYRNDVVFIDTTLPSNVNDELGRQRAKSLVDRAMKENNEKYRMMGRGSVSSPTSIANLLESLPIANAARIYSTILDEGYDNERRTNTSTSDDDDDNTTRSFFQYHSMATSIGERKTQASQKVSTESTRNFAHGNEANSLRGPLSTSRVSSIAESTHSFAHGDEENSLRDRRRVSNVMMTRKNTLRLVNHRGPGDMRHPTKSGSKSVTGGMSKSLIKGEDRVRPIPTSTTSRSSDARVTNHGASSSTTSIGFSSAPASLVGIEGRSRPVPSSDNPKYATRVNTDHRDKGDMRKDATRRSTRTSVLSAVSLVGTEGRSRPVASSTTPEYAIVKDRRSAGDIKDPNRPRGRSGFLTKSLISKEGMVRPVSSTSSSFNNSERVSVANHRGPGDENALTRRRSQEWHQQSTTTPSLSEREQSVRPVSLSSQQVRVTDHRGPGDDNALTKRWSKQRQYLTSSDHSQHYVTTVSSLSADEQRQRPITLSSRQNEARIIVARGDVFRTITDKGQLSMSSTIAVSLSKREKCQRPVPSSNQNQADSAGRISMPVPDNDDDEIDLSDSAVSTAATSMHTFGLSSLLKASKKQVSPTNATEKPPIAAAVAMAPSSLQAVLQDERPMPGSITENGVRPISLRMTPLSSLLKDDKRSRSSQRGKSVLTSASSNYHEKKEWWNEKPQRPRDYVKHYQSMYTSYVTEKFEPPKDYGDVPVDVAANPFRPLRKAGISDNDGVKEEEDGD